MASRRIRRTKSIAGYLDSLNQESSEARLRNNSRSIASEAIGSSALSEEVQILDKAIQSDNYAPGADGWRIDGGGNAEFGNVYVRGDINAYSGTIGYWNISNPLVERTFGDTTLFGTFLESFDHGPTDVDATSGSYVSLFKSYFDDPTSFTAVKLESNKVTLTLTGHNFSVGDPVVVDFDSATYDSLESTTEATVSVVEVTYDTISYYLPSYNASGASDIALTEVTGTVQIYYEDVAGLYLRDYSKRDFDYGYFSNKGVQYRSPYLVNLVKNPSFEWLGSDATSNTVEDAGGYSSSTLAWTAGTGSTLSAFTLDGSSRYLYTSSYGGSFKWTTTALSTYNSATVSYSAASEFKLLNSNRVLYLNFSIYMDIDYLLSSAQTYKASMDLSEVRFRFSNDSTVNLYDILTDECQAEWTSTGGKSWLSANPVFYDPEELTYSKFQNFDKQNPVPRIDAAKLNSAYSTNDNAGYLAGNDFYIDFPNWLYRQSSGASYASFVKTTKWTEATGVGYILDEVLLSTASRFFFGNMPYSINHFYWVSLDNPRDFSPEDGPIYASVETSTDWINLDLNTQVFNLSHVDRLSIESNAVDTLYTDPGMYSIGGFNSVVNKFTSSPITIDEYPTYFGPVSTLTISGGVFERFYEANHEYYEARTDYSSGKGYSGVFNSATVILKDSDGVDVGSVSSSSYAQVDTIFGSEIGFKNIFDQYGVGEEIAEVSISTNIGGTSTANITANLVNVSGTLLAPNMLADTQAGTASITLTSGSPWSTGSATVTFDREFASAPYVVLSPNTGSAAVFTCAASGVSSTEFTARLAFYGSSTATFTVRWIAVIP